MLYLENLSACLVRYAGGRFGFIVNRELFARLIAIGLTVNAGKSYARKAQWALVMKKRNKHYLGWFSYWIAKDFESIKRIVDDWESHFANQAYQDYKRATIPGWGKPKPVKRQIDTDWKD